MNVSEIAEAAVGERVDALALAVDLRSPTARQAQGERLLSGVSIELEDGAVRVWGRNLRARLMASADVRALLGDFQ